MLNSNVLSVGASATIQVADRARELKDGGENVISFAVGEPDFDTPEHIKDKAKEALDIGFTKYTDLKGILPLRTRIAEKLLKENGLEYMPNDIIVSNGAKHAVFNALCALINPGDEVIIITPAWVSYVEQVKLLSGKPVLVSANDDYSLSPDKIEKAITDRTKAIIINTPCNPTGNVFTEKDLRVLADVVKKHDELYVISDEIYEKIVYSPNVHFSIASIDKDIKDKTIVINGFSKAYAMTGFRMGYSASNPEIAKMIARIQSHMTSCPNSISQYCSVYALMMDDVVLDGMIAEFAKRRKIVSDFLDAQPRLSYVPPQGAFYFLIDFSNYIGGRVKNDLELSMYLLEKYHIALTAGTAFFKGNHLRLSYATSEENIIEGLVRLNQALLDI
ncbi:MAG: pyridoxal phosphate-dependent aminotransferase [Candidatus Muiribacteriaceae bacterium]